MIGCRNGVHNESSQFIPRTATDIHSVPELFYEPSYKYKENRKGFVAHTHRDQQELRA